MGRILIMTVLAIGGALPLWADLVLLDNDRHLKVESYRVENGVVHLLTANGAALELPIERVERIIDDEVEVVETPPESPEISRGTWRFERDRVPIFESDYSDWIMELALELDVDAALVSAVIKAESNFDPVAVSHKGAQGLMQLMPATAKRFGVTDPFDPVENIRGGTRYLRVLLDMFDGDVELALAAYNSGEGNVRRYEGVPPFRETQRYVRRIVGYLTAVDHASGPVVTSSLR